MQRTDNIVGYCKSPKMATHPETIEDDYITIRHAKTYKLSGIDRHTEQSDID